MAFIEPFALETWVVSVFAGNPSIFSAIAFFAISVMAGYFRMNGISMFFMLLLFILMFSGYVDPSFLVIFGIVGGLLIGYWISKLVK